MYQAKSAGRNTMRFFDPDMQAAVSARIVLETELRSALRLGQFLLHYQPQVNAAGRPTGAEALVRWDHPQRGMVPPFAFIPLAEETGLIIALGSWVLETACRELAGWANDPALAGLNLAVNVSARQFRQSGFVDEVLAIVHRTGANPHRLKLELTESLLIDDVEQTILVMSQLKAHGVGFSLDDFGIGYSSLSYLKRLPLDQLKIDQSFVRDILTDPNDEAIAGTIVALGTSLGLAVIAEGVETAEQKSRLAALGCFSYQGYYFSRPVPVDVFIAFVRHPVPAG
jgi:EAL domain-containing protein (putative c-di-GMP-specific phosphodiesterase class I)